MSDVEIALTFEMEPVEPALFERLREAFREEFQHACEDIGIHVSERVKRIIIEEKIWYTGTLLNSITWSLIEQTAASLGVAVGTNIGYAKYQEYGTVPHFVPFHLAKILYDQAVYDWGWLKVEPGTVSTRLSKKVRKGPGGMFSITGKHQTYLTRDPTRLWLRPAPGARPVWGVVVSGRAQPFLWPGWEQSLEYCEDRLHEACERAAAHL